MPNLNGERRRGATGREVLNEQGIHGQVFRLTGKWENLTPRR